MHASAIAVPHRGAALILGAAGSGKSSLAMQLIALGARLISDDRVDLTARDGALIAAPAPNIAGMIEARGIGLLHAPAAPACKVALVIDLDQTETDRMPERRTYLHGVDLPLFHKVDNPAWPSAIWLYLSGGKAMP